MKKPTYWETAKKELIKKDRKIFDMSLRMAFRKDSIETNIVGWTAMGLIEIQRARVRSSWK